jgi:hypothetical protein
MKASCLQSLCTPCANLYSQSVFTIHQGQAPFSSLYFQQLNPPLRSRDSAATVCLYQLRNSAHLYSRGMTNSKHISPDPYPLLLYVTAHAQLTDTQETCHLTATYRCCVTSPLLRLAAGHTENTACSTVACVYRVYRAVAWQHVDQIRHNINDNTVNTDYG